MTDTSQNNKSKSGRARRDRVTEAIGLLAHLPEPEFAAAQECVVAIRALAQARAAAAQKASNVA